MLRNELEEIKREHPDGLNVQAGSCRFCGQMDAGNGLKAKISITRKGSIKVEKTETRKEAQEA